MEPSNHPPESHKTHRVGWLRAAVLGANDGAVSVASVVVGVAASGAGAAAVLVAGTAALVAGAVSMAAGEYVSVQSQADTEKADLARERFELKHYPEQELEELTGIYQARGVPAPLAREVAIALTEHDVLAAHARDELGISETLAARPVQAAFSSAASFVAGAILPILAAVFAPQEAVSMVVVAATAVALMLFGGLAGYAGGASIWRGALRVTLWGVAAMALTAFVGSRFDVAAG